jgi:hypothetical protein
MILALPSFQNPIRCNHKGELYSNIFNEYRCNDSQKKTPANKIQQYIKKIINQAWQS